MLKTGIVAAFIIALSAVAHDPPPMRHWEIPSSDPDRIFLSFIGDPTTSRAVTWRTDHTVSNAMAEIAVALGEPNFNRHAKRVEARTEIIDLGQILGKERDPVHYHSAVFQGLEPDTLYAYRVGDGGKRWSEWIQFRTASADHAGFTFVYFGDAQNDVHSRWSRVIRMAHQTAPDAAFALHAGDLINRANRDPEWAGWFKAGSYLHAQWTGVPVIGNHEYTNAGGTSTTERTMSALWRPQFTLPVVASLPETLHETVYSFDYQGTRVIALNSATEVKAQTRFLEEQLKKPGARWLVVTFHHPLFSPGGRGHYEPEERQAWLDLFKKYNVDLVLQGHDHSYLRGQVPMIGNGQPMGFQTLFVTSVSGPKQYPTNREHLEKYRPENYTQARRGENTQFFQVIRIEEELIFYEAYTATGELYDRAVIHKDFTTGAKTIHSEYAGIGERTMENTIEYTKKGL